MISHDGEQAERLFCQLTGAAEAPFKSRADALLDGYLIEVKRSNGTLNQVRPMLYLPIVVFDVRDGSWLVIPPNIVMQMAAKKERGQHCENPFESVTLSLKDLTSFRVEASKLRDAVAEAISQGAASPRLRLAAERIREQARLSADMSLLLVRSLV